METCPCGRLLPPRHRKYCAQHSPLASLLWKRWQRQACRGTAYWLDYWLKVAGDERSARVAYNAYMRAYMRRYRARRKFLNRRFSQPAPTTMQSGHASQTHTGGSAR